MAWIEADRGRWRVAWREGSSKRSRSFLSRTEAESFLVEIGVIKEKERASERERRAAFLTISEVVHNYYARRKRTLQLSTQHHYEQLIAKHITPKVGALSAREAADNPALLQDFYDELPPTTALHCHQILRPAFQYAVDHRRLERNPCSIARPARKRRAEKLIPTAGDVAKIVLAARESDQRFGLFVWLVSRLGLRRGEACALRWEDFRSGRHEVHIRRAIARKRHGTFIKPPKSGEARTILMDPRFFAKLRDFHGEGWLFPRGYNVPYQDATGIARHSTAGRLLNLLDESGGSYSSPRGAAGAEIATPLGLSRYGAGPMLRRLEREGYVASVGNASRTYSIELTDAGRSAIANWPEAPDATLPWFPTTADGKFGELMRHLDLSYTLHSLRHFVATHLYNRNRDWVQLARFLGHSSPSITMSLYANHVVEPSQLALGEAAMELFDDPGFVDQPTFGASANILRGSISQ